MFETENGNGTTTDSTGGTNGGTPSPPASPPPANGNGKNPRVVTLPSDAFTRVKREAEERGARRAKAELDKKAKELGFESHDAMVAAAQAAKNAPKPQTPSRPQQNGNGKKNGRRHDRRNEHQVQQTNAEVLEAKRATALAEKRARMEQAKRREMEAQTELRDMAIAAGARGKSVTYILHQLRESQRHIANDPKAIAAFDEKAWFENLKREEPYLFNAIEVPANTGNTAVPPSPNGNGANPPPAPKVVNDAANKSQSTDVMKMTPAQRDEYYRARKLKNPNKGLGSPGL